MGSDEPRSNEPRSKTKLVLMFVVIGFSVTGAVVALGVGLGLGVTGKARCLNTYANGQQIGRHCPGTDSNSTSSAVMMPSATPAARAVRDRREMLGGAVLTN
ncbi:hypothetical protein RQP46_007211 [Phenoliferia psychrophenolica]